MTRSMIRIKLRGGIWLVTYPSKYMDTSPRSEFTQRRDAAREFCRARNAKEGRGL